VILCTTINKYTKVFFGPRRPQQRIRLPAVDDHLIIKIKISQTRYSYLDDRAANTSSVEAQKSKYLGYSIAVWTECWWSTDHVGQQWVNVCNIVHTMHHAQYHTSIYQLSCTALCFFTYILVLAPMQIIVYYLHPHTASLQLQCLHNTSYAYSHLSVVY